MIVLWSLLFVGGLIAASLASRRAVTQALQAADASNVSAGFIGMTVMAIGTDLPEIANSVISAASGHGDLNVGDSAGSALTQVTLVLAILLFVSRLKSDRAVVATLGALTAVALGVISLLIRDGLFGRLDGLVLVGAWGLSLVGMRTLSSEPSSTGGGTGRVGHHVVRAGLWLVVVAAAATVVVQSFVRLIDSLGVPEILGGAVVLALGTSLPELVVDWTAIRRGAAALALGDLFGSSLLDATFAIGIGPTITPTEVSGAAATTCLIAAAGVVATTVVVATRRTLTRSSGLALLAVYITTTGAFVVAS